MTMCIYTLWIYIHIMNTFIIYMYIHMYIYWFLRNFICGIIISSWMIISVCIKIWRGGKPGGDWRGGKLSAGSSLAPGMLYCNTPLHTVTHCNTLQHTATHCNTLQHTATHCNTLQHTATHCNTLKNYLLDLHRLQVCSAAFLCIFERAWTTTVCVCIYVCLCICVCRSVCVSACVKILRYV